MKWYEVIAAVRLAGRTAIKDMEWFEVVFLGVCYLLGIALAAVILHISYTDGGWLGLMGFIGAAFVVSCGFLTWAKNS